MITNSVPLLHVCSGAALALMIIYNNLLQISCEHRFTFQENDVSQSLQEFIATTKSSECKDSQFKEIMCYSLYMRNQECYPNMYYD